MVVSLVGDDENKKEMMIIRNTRIEKARRNAIGISIFLVCECEISICLCVVGGYCVYFFIEGKAGGSDQAVKRIFFLKIYLLYYIIFCRISCIIF